AIAGNIDSGKTILTAKLAKHYNWLAHFDDTEDNPFLADFYNNMERWAFHLQIHFLNVRFKHAKRAGESKTSIIQDRTIYEDAYIFADALPRSKLMSARDFVTYMELFDSMVENLSPPDLLIYLRADIPKLVEQIHKRARPF